MTSQFRGKGGGVNRVKCNGNDTFPLIIHPYNILLWTFVSQRHTAMLREELMKLKPTKILQEESNKAIQEKAESPTSEAAATGTATSTSTSNAEPSPPVMENGTTLTKPSPDPKPVVAGIDPLGVGNLHNGGEDDAGLY